MPQAMKGHEMRAVHVALLCAGMLLGGVSVTIVGQANGQQPSALGRWQLGVSSATPATAWRLQTDTGHLEMCTLSNGQPACYPIPAPRTSN
jgi:hypothetical protein